MAVLALAACACHGAPRRTVDRMLVGESPSTGALERAGIGRDALRDMAQELFDRAPGFVPPARAGRGATRCAAQLLIRQVEVLGSSEDAAVAHATVAIELVPSSGDGAALTEQGRAAEPVGAEPGGVAAAVRAAVREATGRAVQTLAGRLAAEGKSTAALRKDLASGDAGIRLQAVRALGDRGDRGSVPELVGRLHDPDPEVVERAVGALAQLRDPRAVPALIDLARHRDPAYVASLARILGDIGGPDARAWLLTMSSGHPDEVVRGAAREALSDLAARAPREQEGR